MLGETVSQSLATAAQNYQPHAEAHIPMRTGHKVHLNGVNTLGLDRLRLELLSPLTESMPTSGTWKVAKSG